MTGVEHAQEEGRSGMMIEDRRGEERMRREIIKIVKGTGSREARIRGAAQRAKLEMKKKEKMWNSGFRGTNNQSLILLPYSALFYPRV